MPYLNFNSASPTLKLVITVMSIFTIGLIVSFLGFLLSRIIFCLDVPEANEVLYGNFNNVSIGQLKYYQLVQTLSFFVIPGVFLLWLFSTPGDRYFPTRKIPMISSIGLVVLILLAAIPLMNYLIVYNQQIEFPSFLSGLESQLREMERMAVDLTGDLVSGKSIGALLLNIVILALLPALGEEFIFRGVIQKVFKNISKNTHMAVLLTAILFSAAHMQYFSFLPRFLLGIFFGYLLVWSKTIWLPVLAHFFNNTLVVLMYFLSETENPLGVSNQLEITKPDTLLVILSLGAIIFLSYVLFYVEKRKRLT